MSAINCTLATIAARAHAAVSDQAGAATAEYTTGASLVLAEVALVVIGFTGVP